MKAAVLLIALICVWMSSPTLHAQAVSKRGSTPPIVITPAPTKPAAAPVPSRPVPRTRTTGETRGVTTDLFRAGPYTYAPRDEQRHHRGGVLRNRRDRRYGAPYLAGPWFLANPILMTGDNLARDQVRGAADSMLPQLDDGRQDSGSPAGDREANNALETTQTSFDVIRAAAPKTFYVIPRCYAGDRIPRLEELPRGCELRNLREVPPRRSAQP